MPAKQKSAQPYNATRNSVASADAGRRQRIVAAAGQVICEYGMPETSLRRIAAAMGATTGLVTRYYASKDALLLSVLQDAAGSLTDALTSAGEGRSGIDLVEASLAAALPIALDTRRNWQTWVAFLGLRGGDELAEAYRRFPDQLRLILVRGLREAQLAGQAPSELYAPHVADMLVSQILGVGMRGLSDPVRYPPEKLLSLVAPLFHQAIIRH